jgi:ADP-ribosyl-[dinitrogen reductase] hydrolase
MRLAPLPAFHATRYPTPTSESTTSLLEQVALSSRITHGSPLSIDNARLMATYLLGFYHSRSQTPQERKEEVLSAGFVAPGLSNEDMHFSTTETHEIWASTNFKDLNSATVSTSGFTVDTLQAALWALWNAQTFEDVSTLKDVWFLI